MLKELLLDAQVLQATNFASCRRFLADETFDLLILDMIMPDGTGLEFLKEVRHQYPSLPVLVLSVHAEEDYALRALRAGATSYLAKDSTSQELEQAVRAALLGQRYLRPQTAGKLIGHLLHDGDQPAHHKLSDRELEVLELLARGKTVGTIGDLLQLSPKTVSTYRSRLLEKLNLHNDSELVRYCLEYGLIH